MNWITAALALLGIFVNVDLGCARSFDAAAPPEDFDPVAVGQEILALIANAVDCSSCQGVLTSLKGVAKLGDRAFVASITEVCKLSGAEDDDVCEGILKKEGPIIAHDLREMTIGSHTSINLCANLLGLCQYPKARPHKIDMPKPVHKRVRPKPSRKKPLHIAHISDTHVDLAYETGANYNCTKPICCRSFTPEDAPGNTSYPAGPFGNHECDAPQRLEKNMYEAMNNLIPDLAFTIFTGDVPAHDVWLVTRKEVTKDLQSTYTDMEKLSLLFPAVGNHDTTPVNAFPPKGLDIYNDVNPQWTYNIFAKYWEKWVGKKGAATAHDHGSYSVLYPGTKLRIISFNSIFYYTLNFWTYQDPMQYDPNDQFKWFVRELQAAETAGERVWLIAHIPSGSSDWFRDYSNYFDQIIQRYAGTISACFYGHTHVDEFQIAYQDYNHRNHKTAKMISYIAPSMTPTSGSPTFRVYDVDPETFTILDYTQYIANYSSPQFQKKPVWKKYYSAKETYGKLVSPHLTDPHAELSPPFWHNVTKVFLDDDDAFDGYIKRKTRSYSKQQCKGDCKRLEICGIRAANCEYNCDVTTPGLDFSKRDRLPHEPHIVDDCGESRMRAVFGAARAGGRQGL